MPADPERREFTSDARRGRLTRTEIERLYEFCVELQAAIDDEIDVEAVREQLGDLEHGDEPSDYIDEWLLRNERAYRYVYTIALLTGGANERDFLLSID